MFPGVEAEGTVALSGLFPHSNPELPDVHTDVFSHTFARTFSQSRLAQSDTLLGLIDMMDASMTTASDLAATSSAPPAMVRGGIIT